LRVLRVTRGIPVLRGTLETLDLRVTKVFRVFRVFKDLKVTRVIRVLPEKPPGLLEPSVIQRPLLTYQLMVLYQQTGMVLVSRLQIFSLNRVGLYFTLQPMAKIIQSLEIFGATSQKFKTGLT